MSSSVAIPPNLAECEREPIHIPGSIQPHGYLFVLNEADLSLVAVSENVAGALHVRVTALIGRPIVQLLASETAEELGAAIRAARGEGSMRVRFLSVASESLWDCIVHKADGLILLELFAWTSSDRAAAPFGQFRAAVERIRRSQTAQSVSDVLATEIRALTGFDRVMIYRFDADWNGEVITEDRAAGVASYNGHAFPASDIPEQARALYIRNTMRQIPDARYAPSPIIPAICPSTGLPFDLSAAALRSVSPAHLEYLANMGVAASMSVSIVRDDRLWGLVACHHLAPRQLPNFVLQYCDLLARAMAWFLDAAERTANSDCVATVRQLETEIGADAITDKDYRARLSSAAPALLALTNSQGMAICDDQSIWAVGRRPDDEQIRALVRWLRSTGEERVTTDRLADQIAPAKRYIGDASGIAAVTIAGGWIIWFRTEWAHNLTWAGEPDKLTVEGGRINPRKSFASWQQKICGRSRPWTAPDLFAVEESHMLILRAMMADQMRRLAESEHALTVAKNRADEASRAKSRFLANISHELRTPLNSIIGFSDLIKADTNGSVPPETGEYAALINDSGWHLLSLVNTLLDLSKIEAGKYELNLESFDPGEVIGEAARSLRVTMKNAGIRFDVPTLAGLPVLVADRRALRQVLLNLLSNAMKFTAREGEVSLRAEAFERELRLTVTDSGIGMSEEILSRIGRPFEQADNSVNREGRGTGLGLALTKSLVELHDGNMKISSVEGCGTSVTVTLPLQGPVANPATLPGR